MSENDGGGSAACHCATLSDLAVVPMSGDGSHERTLATLEQLRRYGSEAWWLYLSRCGACRQDWLVAQDDRIYDDFFLRRLSIEAAEAILACSDWPDDFRTYEQVLRAGRELSRPPIFFNTMCLALVDTVRDLRLQRPEMNVDEIAYLLGLSDDHAARLVRA